MPRAKETMVDEAPAAETPATLPVFPAADTVTKDELNAAVANAVANALAGAIPEILAVVSAQKEPTFAGGMGPSENVSLPLVQQSAEVRADYLKHYRLDGVISGKYQELDMDIMDATGDIVEAVKKGEWVHFQNGHFYAWTTNQVRYLDWMIATNPGSKIYESVDEAVIRCTVDGCFEMFGTQAGMLAHLRATHGVGR